MKHIGANQYNELPSTFREWHPINKFVRAVFHDSGAITVYDTSGWVFYRLEFNRYVIGDQYRK